MSALQNATRSSYSTCTAQGAFVEVYQQRVYAVCVALAGADAEDCAQDALLAALLGLGRFDPHGPARLGTFVLRIARNRCIDRARSAHVRASRDASDPDRLVVVAGAVAQLVRADDHETVRAAVLELPDDQRTAIVLQLWGELEYGEIAEIVGVPIGTVRSRLARAKETLRARLAAMVTDDAVEPRTLELP
ncbi:MAG: sigma-70 family RNA polymerase sigma factor [Deltaproteobacteria bacterium]